MPYRNQILAFARMLRLFLYCSLPRDEFEPTYIADTRHAQNTDKIAKKKLWVNNDLIQATLEFYL